MYRCPIQLNYFLHYYHKLYICLQKMMLKKNLRDTFLKEIKKVKKSRSGDAQECAVIYTGKWIYYKSMLFLKDTMTPRDTEGNISEEDDMEQNLNEVEENNDENIEHIQSPVVHSFIVPESETDSYVTVPSVSTVLHSNISNDSNVSAAQVISSKKKGRKIKIIEILKMSY